MRRRATLIIATALGTLTVAGSAQAHSEYIQYIPNGGLKQCNNCHPVGNTLDLNIMGEDTLPHVDKPVEQWWPALRGLDSDGDGQTNGQELGDPCEEWLIGLEPGRTTGISNPGDAADESPTPDVPSCEPSGGAGGAGGSGSGSAGGEGGGATTTGTSGAGASGGTTSGGGTNAGPAGGQGASKPSTGAGKADEPILTDQDRACSTGPASSGSGGALFLFAAAALLTARSRRHRTK